MPIGVFSEDATLALALHTHLLTRAGEMGTSPVRAIVSDSLPFSPVGIAPFRGFVNLQATEVARQGVAQLLWRIGHRNEPRVRRLVPVSFSAGC
jgi:ApbE superfamily uncharacterized protein (UPF0280 family)